MAVKVIFLFSVAVLAENSFLCVSANPIGLSDGIGSHTLLLSSTGLINKGLNIGLNNDIAVKLLHNPYFKTLENSFASNAALVSEAVEGTTAIGSNVVASVTDVGNVRCKKHAPYKQEKESDGEIEENKHGNVKVIEGDGHVIVLDKDDHNNKHMVLVSNGPGSIGVVRSGGDKNFKYSSSTFSGVLPHGVTNAAFVGHSTGHGAGGSILGVSGNGVSVASGAGSIASVGGHPLALKASRVVNDAHSMLRWVTSAASSMLPPGCFGIGV